VVYCCFVVCRPSSDGSEVDHHVWCFYFFNDHCSCCFMNRVKMGQRRHITKSLRKGSILSILRLIYISTMSTTPPQALVFVCPWRILFQCLWVGSDDSYFKIMARLAVEEL
jgi:hypothetical protein